MKVCSSCHTAAEDTSRFCASCGTDIVNTPLVKGVAPEPRAQIGASAPVAPKSMGAALLLAFFLGPFGLFYVSPVGALVILGAFVVLVIISVGLLLPLAWAGGWAASLITAAIATDNHNKRVQR